MKELLENVKLILQFGIIGAILLYIGTLVFMPEMTVKIFRFQPYIVMTESMEPVINVNDMVVISPFNIEEAEVGDIITFKADIDYNGTQETVTHYIYSIEGEGEEAILRTHRHFEDANSVTPDTWLIPATDVMGTYAFQVQYVGYAVGFLKSIYGIAVIAINVIIIGAIKYINKKHEIKEQQELINNIQPDQQKVSTLNDATS